MFVSPPKASSTVVEHDPPVVDFAAGVGVGVTVDLPAGVARVGTWVDAVTAAREDDVDRDGADALEHAPTVVTTASAAANDRPFRDTVRPARIMDFPGASAILPTPPCLDTVPSRPTK